MLGRGLRCGECDSPQRLVAECLVTLELGARESSQWREDREDTHRGELGYPPYGRRGRVQPDHCDRAGIQRSEPPYAVLQGSAVGREPDRRVLAGDVAPGRLRLEDLDVEADLVYARVGEEVEIAKVPGGASIA